LNLDPGMCYSEHTHDFPLSLKKKCSNSLSGLFPQSVQLKERLTLDSLG